ncbi:MAG: hypothetical protein ABSF26_24460 [Thermoguttaceae bacterium]|jgi:hypothetical protein
MHKVVLAGLTAASLWAVAFVGQPATAAEGTRRAEYRDGRPAARYRLEAVDHGILLHHGDGPEKCDILGARDVWVYEANGTYYMHYDAAGPKGRLAALATSKDLIHWQKKGPVLELGKGGENDSASAHIIGLPSVLRVGNRLAVFYDANAEAKMPVGVNSHMNRDIGLAWLRLPLLPPTQEK